MRAGPVGWIKRQSLCLITVFTDSFFFTISLFSFDSANRTGVFFLYVNITNLAAGDINKCGVTWCLNEYINANWDDWVEFICMVYAEGNRMSFFLKKHLPQTSLLILLSWHGRNSNTEQLGRPRWNEYTYPRNEMLCRTTHITPYSSLILPNKNFFNTSVREVPFVSCWHYFAKKKKKIMFIVVTSFSTNRLSALLEYKHLKVCLLVLNRSRSFCNECHFLFNSSFADSVSLPL